MSFVAIDPGEIHVGWAWFTPDHGEYSCTEAEEITPDQLLERLRGNQNYWEYVVIENFTVYPHTATALIGTDLATSRLIGRVEEICHTQGVALIKQPAHILRTTNELLKFKHIPLVSRGHGGHARDAELHGWFRVWQGRDKLTP